MVSYRDRHSPGSWGQVPGSALGKQICMWRAGQQNNSSRLCWVHIRWRSHIEHRSSRAAWGHCVPSQLPSTLLSLLFKGQQKKEQLGCAGNAALGKGSRVHDLRWPCSADSNGLATVGYSGEETSRVLKCCLNPLLSRETHLCADEEHLDCGVCQETSLC